MRCDHSLASWRASTGEPVSASLSLSQVDSKCYQMPRLRHCRTCSSSYGRHRALALVASKLQDAFHGAKCLSMSAAPQPLPDTPPTSPPSPQVEAILDYHDRTKHSFQRYADTPSGLDWANQPYPFRKYVGIKPIPLRHLPPIEGNPADQPYNRVFSEFFNPSVVGKAALSQLLYDSFAVAVWKQGGEVIWPLRVLPSSGNLHPTECYVISSSMLGITDKPYIAHYAAREHALELRAEVPLEVINEMKKDLPHDTFFLALTSIHWRQAWKYGDRGLRYCYQDMGHAIGAVSMAACCLGWDALLLDGWGNADLDHLLGMSGRKAIPVGAPMKGYYPELEQERSCCLIAIYPGRRKVDFDYNCKSTVLVKIANVTVPSDSLLEAVRSRMAGVKWNGRLNELSKEHVWSDTLEKAAVACEKPTMPTELNTPALPQYWIFTHHYKPYTLRQLIHKRRSAIKFDGKHVLEKEALYQMMWKALPSGYCAERQGSTHQFPFRILPWKAEVHLAIFAHRIAGLPKGFYILVRNEDHEQQLRQVLRPQFMWEKPEKCPAKLPFYKLAESDMEKLSMQMHCHQEIGGSGCFSVAMIARFDPLNEKGPWMYPRLHWECGVLGQLLYMEAYSMGLSGSGIGCYFDDPVHQVLGIQGKEFQSLYHFAVGVAVEDKRILDLPPYPPADKPQDKKCVLD